MLVVLVTYYCYCLHISVGGYILVLLVTFDCYWLHISVTSYVSVNCYRLVLLVTY